MARDNIISSKFRGFPRTIRCTISIYAHDTRRPTSIQVSRATTRPDSPAASQVHESARPEASVRSLRNDRWQDSSWNDKKRRERGRKKRGNKQPRVGNITEVPSIWTVLFRFYLNLYIYIFGAAEWNETRVVKKWIEVVFCGIKFDWQIFWGSV